MIKSITALPSDATLLSLSPEPLLDLVCTAARVQLTAVWLSLAALLVVQLDPPVWPRLTKDSDAETQRRTNIVAQATTGLVGAGLAMLNSGVAMEANPDVAQDFFGYLTKVRTTETSVAFLKPSDNAVNRLAGTFPRSSSKCLEMSRMGYLELPRLR